MSQQISLSVPTEIMTPGQTSDALRVKLKQVGSRITDEQLVKAFSQLEASRRRFAAESIGLGALFVAKKASLKHGQWLPWCEKFAKLAAVANLTVNGGSSARTVRLYASVAEHFLSDLEQGSFARDGQDMGVELPKFNADDVLAIERLPKTRREQITTEVEKWIGGRSLKRMLIDFRRAEYADDEELAAHEREKAGKGKGDKAAGNSPGQVDFWDEIKVKIDAITNIIEAESTVKHASKAFWDQLASALEEQAKVARVRAKEMAS